MKRLLSLSLVTLLFTFTLGASAAEETDVVEFLRFNVGAHFNHEFAQGTFKQDRAYAGSREYESNFVSTEVQFGAFYNLEIYLNTRYVTWDRTRWQNISFAGQIPTDGDDQVEFRKGLGDFTLGARYAILNAKRRPADLSSWVVEFAFTFPTGEFVPYPTTKNNAVTDPPEVGVGGGGLDTYFATSFSRRFGRFDPYATFFVEGRGKRDLSGAQTYNPGNSYGTFFGLEIIGFERKSDGLKFAADAAAGWKWTNEGGTFTNRFLYGPDDTTGAGSPGGSVLEEGHVDYVVRAGFAYQVHQYLRVRSYAWFIHDGKHFMEKYPTGFTDTKTGSQLRNFDFVDFRYEAGLLFTY